MHKHISIALHALHTTRSSHKKAVRLCVRLSVRRLSVKSSDLWQNEKSCAHIYIPIWKNIYPSFVTRSMVDRGRPFLLKIVGQKIPLERKRRVLQSIFARSASAVKPTEKVQWALEVHYALSNEPKMNIVRCPYPPTKGVKNAKRPFYV